VHLLLGKSVKNVIYTKGQVNDAVDERADMFNYIREKLFAQHILQIVKHSPISKEYSAEDFIESIGKEQDWFCPQCGGLVIGPIKRCPKCKNKIIWG
jgi:rubrerythrin